MPYRCCLLLFLLSTALTAQADPVAYALYTGTGKPVKFKKMVRDLRTADVILFGELHNNPIAHWMQLEVAAALDTYDLGLEMLEADEQEALDAFRGGTVDLRQLDSLTGGLWPGFRTDYLPVIERAGGPDTARVIATNVPRRYASLVFRGGFAVLDELPAAERALLAPLPIPYDADLPAYRAMLEMMPGGHGGETFPMAQAIKDATMAHRIALHLRPRIPFLHLNGSYHSDDHEGIGWYLRRYAPGKRIVTITTVEQADVGRLAEETRGKADYVLVVPTTMTKSR